MVRDTLTCTLSSIKYLHTKLREMLTRIRATVLNNHNTYALHVVLWNPRVTAIGSRISSLSPSASWLFHIPSLSALASRSGIVSNLVFRQNDFCIWQRLQYTFTIYLISVYANGTSAYIYVVSTYASPRACIHGILFLRVKYKKRLRLAG